MLSQTILFEVALLALLGVALLNQFRLVPSEDKADRKFWPAAAVILLVATILLLLPISLLATVVTMAFFAIAVAVLFLGGLSVFSMFVLLALLSFLWWILPWEIFCLIIALIVGALFLMLLFAYLIEASVFLFVFALCTLLLALFMGLMKWLMALLLALLCTLEPTMCKGETSETTETVIVEGSVPKTVATGTSVTLTGGMGCMKATQQLGRPYTLGECIAWARAIQRPVVVNGKFTLAPNLSEGDRMFFDENGVLVLVHHDSGGAPTEYRPR